MKDRGGGDVKKRTQVRAHLNISAGEGRQGRGKIMYKLYQDTSPHIYIQTVAYRTRVHS